MNHVSTKPTASGLDVMAYLFSLLSLLGSAIVATWLIPGAKTGIDGLALMLTLIVIACQVGGFLLMVGLPVLIQAKRQQLRICRAAVAAAAVAMIAVAVEGITLAFTPWVSRC